MNILVVGSFMMDQVVTTSLVPQKGETVIGESFTINPGGKGANQAVTAKRLGANVKMVGQLGDDPNGEIFVRVLDEEGIDIQDILIDTKQSTGVGFITKETSGDNRIIVIPGANMTYKYSDFEKIIDKLDEISIAILQLEMDFEVTYKIISKLQNLQIPIILNPAPAQILSDKWLSKINYLTPNETELGILTNSVIETLEDVEKAVNQLLNKGVDNVIVTLGDKGAYFANQFETGYVEANKVEVVDTVAAGDSFNGALAVAILEGKSMRDSVMFANRVGSMTVTKVGAISSLPYRKDLDS
ncbi:ribokinase [Erysipelothrix inopinata]|uniref:Deoxyribokinase n=1 Tax=Erysipelothrix inopinata TaxID=225084 RepID=A0A7G9RZR0_9FIRM|nr:ribokinase [Erysipelothrix inopinata]QNN61085.1 ribokinase [Erysipelothrix inopinata]